MNKLAKDFLRFEEDFPLLKKKKIVDMVWTPFERFM